MTKVNRGLADDVAPSASITVRDVGGTEVGSFDTSDRLSETFTVLAGGTYTVSESVAGHEVYALEASVAVGGGAPEPLAGGKAVTVSADTAVTITNSYALNTPQPSATPKPDRYAAYLLINKVDPDDRPVAGAGFSVSNGQTTQHSDGLTDKNGRLLIGLAEVGSFTITETTVPEGYASASPVTVTVTAEHTQHNPCEVMIVNERACAPTEQPTPTCAPTERPTEQPTPTCAPTERPTEQPTEQPTPTCAPTEQPTEQPTPTCAPTEQPTERPTPTCAPTEQPTEQPTPTCAPTEQPTERPTPTCAPTEQPTERPTEQPTPTCAPTGRPTARPTAAPTDEADDEEVPKTGDDGYGYLYALLGLSGLSMMAMLRLLRKLRRS